MSGSAAEATREQAILLQCHGSSELSRMRGRREDAMEAPS
jgi:hypothetical protein